MQIDQCLQYNTYYGSIMLDAFYACYTQNFADLICTSLPNICSDTVTCDEKVSIVLAAIITSLS